MMTMMNLGVVVLVEVREMWMLGVLQVIIMNPVTSSPQFLRMTATIQRVLCKLRYERCENFIYNY